MKLSSKYLISILIVFGAQQVDAKVPRNPMVPANPVTPAIPEDVNPVVVRNIERGNLTQDDVRHILNQPIDLQALYLQTILKSVRTLKELKKEVGRFSLVNKGFKNIVDSGQGRAVIRNRYIEILQNVQKELQPWIAKAKDRGEATTLHYIDFPDIVKNGIDAVVPEKSRTGADTGRERYTTLALLIGKIEPKDQNYWPIKLLVDNDANVNKATADGWTPLMLAARADNIAIANLLLKNGAKINQQDNAGMTALMHAIEKERYNMVKFLLNKYADINIKTYPGRYNISNMNALQYAQYTVRDHHESDANLAIVQLLQTRMGH